MPTFEPDQLYGRGYLEATRRALHGEAGAAPHGPALEQDVTVQPNGPSLQESQEVR